MLHAVDIGIDLCPVACLNLRSEARKDLADVFLVFMVEVAGQCVCSSIPFDPVFRTMREDSQRLPTFVQEDIGGE